MVKKCTKIYNGRIHGYILLLFGGLLVAVAVTVCLSSLIKKAVLTMRSGLLTSFSNILLTRLRISNMAASNASGDPFKSGSASVMYL